MPAKDSLPEAQQIAPQGKRAVAPLTPAALTREARQKAFDERLAELMAAIAEGGEGIETFDEAVTAMWDDPAWKPLLLAMGCTGLDLRGKPFRDPKAAATPHDVSTAATRRSAFNARIDELTRPKAHGGAGLAYNAAIDAMRQNPRDAELLRAMEAGPR